MKRQFRKAAIRAVGALAATAVGGGVLAPGAVDASGCGDERMFVFRNDSPMTARYMCGDNQRWFNQTSSMPERTCCGSLTITAPYGFERKVEACGDDDRDMVKRAVLQWAFNTGFQLRESCRRK